MITPSISPSETYKLLQTLLKIDMPVFIHGSPGIGKSYIVNDIAKQNSWRIIDVRLTLLDAVDMRGVPSIVDNKSVWMPPVFLPDEECDGILFLDELNSAPQSVQVAVYQLILDRKIGEYTLPKGWRIVCAGNKISDRGVVFRLPSPLANRMAHILLQPTFEDFKNWAIKNSIHPFVIGFLGFRPDLLSNESPKDNEANPAFATPRSWSMLSKVLYETSEDVEDVSAIVYGLVGFAAGVEFMSYTKVYADLPDVDMILEGASMTIKNEPSLLYALVSAIVSRYSKIEQGKHVLEYSKTLPVEFAVILIKDLVTKDESFCQVDGFDDWLERHSDLIL